MGYEELKNIPKDPTERQEWVIRKPSVLEFVHEWDTENDPDFRYHNGNQEPLGFGHIGMQVPDIARTVDRLVEKDVFFCKRTNDGAFKGLAYGEEPDGYRIEFFNPINWRNMYIPEKRPENGN